MAARRYAPVLILAPYAVWVAVSVDVVVAVLGAAMVAMGVRASARPRPAGRRRRWALACGVHARPGRAVLVRRTVARACRSVCLYFARRRAVPQRGHRARRAAARCWPRSWPDSAGSTGCWSARGRLRGPGRAAPLGAVVGRHQRGGAGAGRRPAAGPQPAPDPQHRRAGRSWSAPASRSRSRSSPGWPAAGPRRPGCRSSRGSRSPRWRPSGRAASRRPAPLLLVGVGALTAIVVEAVLATPGSGRPASTSRSSRTAELRRARPAPAGRRSRRPRRRRAAGSPGPA